MRFSFASLVAAAALVSKASAEIFITSPVASTSCAAGADCVVSWNDDGKAPLLAAIGPCTVGLYVGNQQQQTKLQDISPSIDVSTNSQVVFKIDPTVGENSNQYFVRFDSIALKATANPAFPYQSFSAKFTVTGMTGTFTDAVKAQLAGTTGPAAASTPAVTQAQTTAAAGNTAGGNSATVTTSVVKAAATTTASAKATTSSAAANGAVSVVIPGVVGSLAGVTIATAMAGFMIGMVALGF